MFVEFLATYSISFGTDDDTIILLMLYYYMGLLDCQI